MLRGDGLDGAFLHVALEKETNCAVLIPHADSSVNRQIDNDPFAIRRGHLRAANDIQHLVFLSSPHPPSVVLFLDLVDSTTVKKGTQW